MNGPKYTSKRMHAHTDIISRLFSWCYRHKWKGEVKNRKEMKNENIIQIEQKENVFYAIGLLTTARYNVSVWDLLEKRIKEQKNGIKKERSLSVTGIKKIVLYRIDSILCVFIYRSLIGCLV